MHIYTHAIYVCAYTCAHICMCTYMCTCTHTCIWLPWWLNGEELSVNEGDVGMIPGSG